MEQPKLLAAVIGLNILLSWLHVPDALPLNGNVPHDLETKLHRNAYHD